MKKILLLPVIALTLHIFTGNRSCTSRTQKNQLNHSHLFGKEGMEESRLRAEWELSRLADPATGKIPEGMRAKELAFSATLPTDDGFFKTRLGGNNLVFDSRGPWNIGGRTRAFAADVANPNMLLAGAVSGGIWKSTNDGMNWIRVTPVDDYPGVNDLIQDKRAGKSNIWYALSGEAYGTSASGGGAFYLGNGMLKSTDNGDTWAPIASTVTGTPQTFENFWDATWNLSLDSTDAANDIVYAAMIGTIRKSTNGGTSWVNVKGGNTSFYSYFANVMTTPGGVTYATLSSEGQDAGIWRSGDGLNWNLINPPFMPADYGRIVSGYVPQNENVVYFLAAQTDTAGKKTLNFQKDEEWNSLWRYRYVSGNGSGAGGVWEDLSINLPANGWPFNNFNAQGGYDLLVKVKPDDSNFVIAGGTNLFRSTTAFNDSLNTQLVGGYDTNAPPPTVTNLIYLNQHPDQHVLFFADGNTNKVYSGNDGGLFMTTDISAQYPAWTSLNNGYLSTQFYTAALDHGTSGSDKIIGGLQDNGTFFTNNTTLSSPWTWSAGGDGAYCAITDGGGNYYFSKQLGKMLKTTVDNNGNITAYERIDPIGGSKYGFINPYILDPNNQNIMYLAAGQRVWRNNDLSGIPLTNAYDSISTNWFLFPDSIPGDSTHEITALAMGKTPANRLYIGTANKAIYRVDNPAAASPTFTYISSSAMPSGHVSCIAVDPDNGDHLIAVFSNYNVYSLWNSTNGGSAWTKCGGNLEQNTGGTGNGPSCRWASIIPRPDGVAYLVGTSTGLYATLSLNGTSTVWVKQGASTLGSAIVDMIDYRLSDGRVIIATHGSGMWSTTISTALSVAHPSTAALKDELFSVKFFPNPLAENSGIEITLQQPAEVNIEILDELGRLMRRISAGKINAGTQYIPIKETGLAAGIYYCKIVAGGEIKTVSFLKE